MSAFRVTALFRENASIEAIESHLVDQRRIVAQLEALAAERRAQIEAGTWPPTPENGDTP